MTEVINSKENDILDFVKIPSNSVSLLSSPNRLDIKKTI